MATVFAPPPPAAVSRILSTFDRTQLAGFIAIAIDLLDMAEGDPDAEQAWPEDDRARGQGDQLEDAEQDDEPEDAESPTDAAWLERVDQTTGQPWRMRRETFVDRGTGEAIGTTEDAEDDDPDSEGCDDEDGGDREPDHTDAPTILFALDQRRDFYAGELAATDTMFAGNDA